MKETVYTGKPGYRMQLIPCPLDLRHHFPHVLSYAALTSVHEQLCIAQIGVLSVHHYIVPKDRKIYYAVGSRPEHSKLEWPYAYAKLQD